MQTNAEMQINITGSDEESRRVVGNVLANALDEAGFTSVNLINQLNENEEREDDTTLLELISATRPELFAVDISVRNNCLPEEDSESDTVVAEVAEETLEPVEPF